MTKNEAIDRLARWRESHTEAVRLKDVDDHCRVWAATFYAESLRDMTAAIINGRSAAANGYGREPLWKERHYTKQVITTDAGLLTHAMIERLTNE